MNLNDIKWLNGSRELDILYGRTTPNFDAVKNVFSEYNMDKHSRHIAEHFAKQIGVFRERTYSRPNRDVEQKNTDTQPINTFEKSIKKVFELAKEKTVNMSVTAALIRELGIYTYYENQLRSLKVRAYSEEAWNIISDQTNYKASSLKLCYSAFNEISKSNESKRGYRDITTSPKNIHRAKEIIKKYGLIKSSIATSL